jgi:hypothetical protein
VQYKSRRAQHVKFPEQMMQTCRSESSEHPRSKFLNFYEHLIADGDNCPHVASFISPPPITIFQRCRCRPRESAAQCTLMPRLVTWCAAHYCAAIERRKEKKKS